MTVFIAATKKLCFMFYLFIHNCFYFRKCWHPEKVRKHSRTEVFCKKGALKNFTKFAGKHLCQSLFFNKVAGLRLFACCLLLKLLLKLLSIRRRNNRNNRNRIEIANAQVDKVDNVQIMLLPNL